MIYQEISLDRPIEDRIAWAMKCYKYCGDRLLGDQEMVKLLKDFKNAVQASHEKMISAGITKECKACEEKDGGSCCGSGLENKYSGSLLLINLLLGQNLPRKRFDPKGCYFLGKDGCMLIARHVICVNYICNKITEKVNPELIYALREKEGIELKILFMLNEKIKGLLKY